MTWSDIDELENVAELTSKDERYVGGAYVLKEIWQHFTTLSAQTADANI